MSNMDTTSTCDYSDPYSESFHPFLLFRIVLIKSAPAYAKHCTFLRKALQLPTQSFATTNAKLCNRQRKALPDSGLHLGMPSPCFFPLSPKKVICLL